MMNSDKYKCAKHRVAAIIEQLEDLRVELKESGCRVSAAAVQVVLTNK